MKTLGTIVGWVCVLLVAALTIFSGVMEFIMPMNDPEVAAYVARLGVGGMEYYLGVAKLAIAALYLLPRTSTVGFVLMVGYYGGALATNITHGFAFAEYAMLIVVFAVMTLGAYFRNPELLWRIQGRTNL